MPRLARSQPNAARASLAPSSRSRPALPSLVDTLPLPHSPAQASHISAARPVSRGGTLACPRANARGETAVVRLPVRPEGDRRRAVARLAARAAASLPLHTPCAAAVPLEDVLARWSCRSLRLCRPRLPLARLVLVRLPPDPRRQALVRLWCVHLLVPLAHSRADSLYASLQATAGRPTASTLPAVLTLLNSPCARAPAARVRLVPLLPLAQAHARR